MNGIKKIMNKLLKWFKGLGKTQLILLTCLCLDTILCSLAYPSIRKVTGELLPARYFAIEGIVASLAVVISCSLWNSKKFRVFSFKSYRILAILELIGFLAIGISQFLWFNVWVFAIGSLCFGSVICVYINRIVNSFRVALFPDRKREFYDNNVRLVNSVSGLIGLGLAAIIPIPLNVAVLLWGIGTTLTVGWLIIHKNNRELLDTIEDRSSEDSQNNSEIL